jgi:hypothetical protein
MGDFPPQFACARVGYLGSDPPWNPRSQRRVSNAVTIVSYTVTAYWITPYFEDRPADPTWFETKGEDSNVILRWAQYMEPYSYSYESIAPGSPARL